MVVILETNSSTNGTETFCFQESHLFNVDPIRRGQSIVIDAGCHCASVIAGAIPYNRLQAGGYGLIKEGFHLLADDVKDLQPDKPASGSGEGNLRDRVERIRIVADQFKCLRQVSVGCQFGYSSRCSYNHAHHEIAATEGIPS